MKFLLFCLVTTFSVSVHAECDKKIDPSKIILFVDTNNSEPEIETAQKSACERGEKLMVIPNNHRDFSAIIQENIRLKKAITECLENCESIKQQYDESVKKYNSFRKSQKPMTEQMSEALVAIKKQKGKIQSFIISGHNGGGSFSGNKGRLSRRDLLTLMKQFPEVNDVKSAMLLGCYTGVQNEIAEWKFIFPEAKLIAGYDLKAPLADVPAGHQYITEILGKEKELIAQAEQNALNDFAKNQIPSMFAFDMFTAVYLNCGPENKDFYFASAKEDQLFTPLDKNNCAFKQSEITQLILDIAPYATGELEPPLDTNGPIREIYNKARALEHCQKLFPYDFNVNNIFNLLFYENFKNNYAKFYEEDLAEVEKILATINIEDLEKGVNQEIKQIEQEMVKVEKEIELIKSGNYPQVKNEEANDLSKQMDHLLKSHPFLRRHKQGTPLTPEQKDIHNKYFALSAKRKKVYNEILNFQTNDDFVIRSLLISEANSHKQNITKLNENIQALKLDPSVLKSLWSPTQKNLEQKSRKELMDNINKMNFVMSLQGVNTEQRAALSFVTTNTTNHLQHFQNPFSWYDYNPDHIEKPAKIARLADFKKGTVPYPYGGMGVSGFGTNSISDYPGRGAGMVGGMMGGVGSGYEIQPPAENNAP